MPTNWFPAKAYAYQPATGVTSQMPKPVYDAAASRLAEEQKQRDAKREKIQLPDGTFYYKDAPSVIYPGTTPQEKAYYDKVNANPQLFNPVQKPVGPSTYFRGTPESLFSLPDKFKNQSFAPNDPRRLFTPPGSPQQMSSNASYAATPESQAAYKKLIEGRDLDKELADFLATPEMQLRMNTPSQVKIPEGQYDPASPPPNSSYNPTSTFAPPPVMPATSPAGNNIASGAVAPPNPSSAMSGTQLSTASPNTGTIGQDTNQSPFSPNSGTRKRTGANKYFNQNWFGTKQTA